MRSPKRPTRIREISTISIWIRGSPPPPGGFCGGSHWAPRTSRWGKRFTHPVMNDSGTLARSINFENKRTNIVGRRNNRTRIFSKGAYYNIYTTEKSVPVRGKRGRSRERYGHYAAVHNTDPKFGLYTVNQYSSRRPVHRQFIGFSPKIDSLTIGAICSYVDFYRAKKNRDPSYASYLISIDKLCKNVTWQSYIRLEEFIND